jgi:hypothetical protein
MTHCHVQMPFQKRNMNMPLFDARFQPLKPYENPKTPGQPYGEIGISTPSEITNLHCEFAEAIELAISCGTEPQTLSPRLGALIEAAMKHKSAIYVDDPLGQYPTLCQHNEATLMQLHNCFLTSEQSA